MITNLDLAKHQNLRPITSVTRLHLKISGSRMVQLLIALEPFFPSVEYLNLICCYEIYIAKEVDDCLRRDVHDEEATSFFPALRHWSLSMSDTVVDRCPLIGRHANNINNNTIT